VLLDKSSPAPLGERCLPPSHLCSPKKRYGGGLPREKMSEKAWDIIIISWIATVFYSIAGLFAWELRHVPGVRLFLIIIFGVPTALLLISTYMWYMKAIQGKLFARRLFGFSLLLIVVIFIVEVVVLRERIKTLWGVALAVAASIPIFSLLWVLGASEYGYKKSLFLTIAYYIVIMLILTRILRWWVLRLLRF
jgi:hypothetical protein